jgi:hypothetical protein
MRLRLAIGLLSAFAVCASPPPASSPRDTLAALNALGLDSARVYSISQADRIELHAGDMIMALEGGKLAFYQPFEGRITGFVFSGIGHTLAIPHDPVEKQQMARFLGAPILDQTFVSIYARFTDDTAKELLAQFKQASLQPAPDDSFAALWQSNIERLNPSHSLRILVENYSSTPRHYFHAAIDGILTGPFDVLVDPMHSENFMLGQPRMVNHVPYYDVWSSYATTGFAPPPAAFDALHYHINTTIRPDDSIEADTTVDFRALAGGQSILFVQLARALKVDSVSLPSGESLFFFQNEGLTEQEVRSRGDDTLCIFFPTPPHAGDTFSLRFRYRGNVIENYGNSVLFVGARSSWFPHFGDPSSFASYDLDFRWPKHLRLVATGDQSGEREDGDFRLAHWKPNRPVSEAGFNLGEYAVASISSANHTVEVAANKILEEAILARLNRATATLQEIPRIPLADSRTPIYIAPPPPSPADALKSLAREVESAINFYEKYCGPFPFHSLAVSQIPGTFGQGWPGLLYLSTYSFLPAEAQERAGLTSSSQESFTDIIPVHEVAHQWWGNMVGWSSYHDQWIDEGLAVYLALLFADSQKNPDRTLPAWLTRYRKRLITKYPESDLTPAEIGPVYMGNRLSSSKSPDAYEVIVYCKSAWIFHMLREMLRDPKSGDPDARFIALLHTLLAKYDQKALSTEQLQREVEAVMTRKMDLEGGRSMEWFFQQYVYSTGIPRYRLEFSTRRVDKGFQVRGKIFQSDVPRSFIAPVPLYVSTASGRTNYLGTVVTSGEETSFTFTSATDAHKIVVDPRMTLLCVPE